MPSCLVKPDTEGEKVSKPLIVGQIRTDDFIALQIVAIAAKWDVMDTLVILEKSEESDKHHVVSEITTNPDIGRRNVQIYTDVDEGDYIRPSAEIALQDWMDRAFGVNIF